MLLDKALIFALIIGLFLLLLAIGWYIERD